MPIIFIEFPITSPLLSVFYIHFPDAEFLVTYHNLDKFQRKALPLFLVTLFALDRAFIVQVMARDALRMGWFLAPSDDFICIRQVAVKTFAILKNLMITMWKTDLAGSLLEQNSLWS